MHYFFFQSELANRVFLTDVLTSIYPIYMLVEKYAGINWATLILCIMLERMLFWNSVKSMFKPIKMIWRYHLWGDWEGRVALFQFITLLFMSAALLGSPNLSMGETMVLICRIYVQLIWQQTQIARAERSAKETEMAADKKMRKDLWEE